MTHSSFARQLTGASGIYDLMEDLGEALNVNPDLLFLGGGNPAQIPQFESTISHHLKTIISDPKQLNKLIGVYQSPQGSEEFIDALVQYFRQHCGWRIGPQNITITNGSQSAFFTLINMLTGQVGAHQRHMLFPMIPEYLGYFDQGVESNTFRGVLPKIHMLDHQFYKYKVDFDSLSLDDSTAALCVSRPTNPTGNMITAGEVEKLSSMAASNNIPLILDCAYGNPFPGIVYEQIETLWDERNIVVLSLSKLGLPGARTGIVIAEEGLIQNVAKINTIMNLSSGNFGPVLMTSLLNSGALPTLTQNTILPFYRNQRDFMLSKISEYFSDVQYRIHVPEGAFFLWLWFEGLTISSTELYQRLKDKGVLVMDGKHFFYGVDDSYSHANECLRLSYCQSETVIDSALQIIAAELRTLS